MTCDVRLSLHLEWVNCSTSGRHSN